MATATWTYLCIYTDGDDGRGQDEEAVWRDVAGFRTDMVERADRTVWDPPSMAPIR
jgi:hypothetical protein